MELLPKISSAKLQGISIAPVPKTGNRSTTAIKSASKGAKFTPRIIKPIVSSMKVKTKSQKYPFKILAMFVLKISFIFKNLEYDFSPQIREIKLASELKSFAIKQLAASEITLPNKKEGAFFAVIAAKVENASAALVVMAFIIPSIISLMLCENSGEIF